MFRTWLQGAGAQGRSPWPENALGLAIWITLDKDAKAKGHHTLSKVPRRKQTRTSHFCKKKERDIYTTRTSVKAIVSWKKLTSVSDLPGLKHTAQQSPRWHLTRESASACVWGTDKRNKSWLTGGQLPSRLHAKGFSMWTATSEHHTETTWENKPENYLGCGNQAWKCAVKT